MQREMGLNSYEDFTRLDILQRKVAILEKMLEELRWLVFWHAFPGPIDRTRFDALQKELEGCESERMDRQGEGAAAP